MGYRNYISSISRKEYDVIKNFTREELYKYKKEDLEEGYVSIRDVLDGDLYELGKYVDKFPKRVFKSFFVDKATQDYFTKEREGELYLVGKKFLENVIVTYGLKIQTYYKDLLKDLLTDEKYPVLKDPKEYNSESIYKLADHVNRMAAEWGCSAFSDKMPYNLKTGDAVTTSWKYEYVQFELVRIYKTFDWKNNVLVYYGS
jgi:hypothetical protein